MSAQPIDPFTLAHVTADPGTRAAGDLTIAPRGDRGATIPFTILHGAQPGPTLLLVAGVHGSEYVPIVALQRLRLAIDPHTLRGTVLMVHAANMPSFLVRTVYYGPDDGQNLNRVFPGRVDGTLSERIAEAITTHFLSRATHVIDLHGGDGNESLRPYAYWITTGDPRVSEMSRDLALAFGLDRIVVDDERPTDAAKSMYLSNTAITRGIPAVTTETGCLGRVDHDAVALAERGVMSVLRHLGMQDEGPVPTTDPIWLKKNAVLRAKTTGLFEASVERGQHVQTGAPIGRVLDFHGKVLEEISAPFAGEILYVVRTPPMSAGEPVAMVSAPA
jgi:predicted deacylase